MKKRIYEILNLKEIFQDTQKCYSTNPRLKAACDFSKKNHVFYKAGEKIACELNKSDTYAKVVVSKKRSFEAAEKYSKAGFKTAVLNFANSFCPGGGVVEGARAQEECLCRISTLYDSISSQEMMEKFYEPHVLDGNDLATDDIIYTPKVTVFKSDTNFPEMLPEEDWFSADVLTCAALCLDWDTNSISNEELRQLHYSRGKHILDVACSNNAEVLILGAFGCGAFSNPPEIVASVYKELISEYRKTLKTIEFAIYCEEYESQNYICFKDILSKK